MGEIIGLEGLLEWVLHGTLFRERNGGLLLSIFPCFFGCEDLKLHFLFDY